MSISECVKQDCCLQNDCCALACQAGSYLRHAAAAAARGRSLTMTLHDYLREARALGERVRQLREAAGLTLEAAAARADVDWKHWQKVGTGIKGGTAALNITFGTLVRIAAGLARRAGRAVRPASRALEALRRHGLGTEARLEVNVVLPAPLTERRA